MESPEKTKEGSNPKVFIGMPAYNGERFIGEAIDSLLAQSYHDFTLFISDDTSTDKTREICKKYAEKDSRIKYYRQPRNIGMFPNFKFLIDKADCEYFMWAAQDDLWEKEFISTCVRNLEINKETGFSMTNITEIDSSGQVVRELTNLHSFSSKKPSLKIVSIYIMQPEILGKGNLMYSFFSTTTIKTVWGIYPQRMTWGADYLFSLALISHFGGIINKKSLFKKRYGGFSNPVPINTATRDNIRKITPKNNIFPFGRAYQYLNGHIEALGANPYRLIGILLFLLRIPRSYLLSIRERFKKRIQAYEAQKIHRNKQKVLDFYRKAFGLKILVETGTYKGDMVEVMRNEFKKIFSIELGENLCKVAQNRGAKHPRRPGPQPANESQRPVLRQKKRANYHHPPA